MKKNKSASKNKLTSVALFLVLLFVGLYLVSQKTDIFPSASRSKSELRPDNRLIKAKAALATTPVVENNTHLLDLIKELDSMSVADIANDMSQNDLDSINF